VGLLVFYFAGIYFYPIPGIKPLYFQLLFLAIAVYWFILFPRNFSIKGPGSKALMIWSLTYTMFIIILYLISSQSDTATQILITWLKAPLFLISFMLIFSSKLNNLSATNPITFIFLIIAVFAVCMNIYDFFNPTLSKVPGRAAGFYINPNVAGSTIAYAMTVSVLALSRKFRFPFIIFCGLGVLLTFSRGAWLVWVVGVVYLAWGGDAVSMRRKIILGGGAVLFGLVVLAFLFTGLLGQIIFNSSLSEYLTPNTMARLGIGASQFADHSASSRADVVLGGLNFGARAPVFGQGLAFTRENLGWPYRVSTHNMYVLFWAEGGLTGVLVFLSFLGIVWKFGVGIGRVLAVQMALDSLFTHNLLEVPVTAILAAYVVALGDARRQRNAQARRSVVHALRI